MGNIAYPSKDNQHRKNNREVPSEIFCSERLNPNIRSLTCQYECDANGIGQPVGITGDLSDAGSAC